MILHILTGVSSSKGYLPTDIEPPPPGSYVKDPDGLLDEYIITQLNENIIKIKEVQIGMLIINKMQQGFYNSYYVKDNAAKEFCTQVFDYWGVGRKDKNDGILVFISVIDRKFWIITGAGAKQYLSDSSIKSVFKSVKSQLKSGNFGQAMLQSISQIDDNIHPSFLSRIMGWALFLIVALLIVAVAVFSYKSQNERKDFQSKLKKLQQLQRRGQLNNQFLSTSCGICLQEFDRQDKSNETGRINQQGIVLYCGHNLHRQCLMDWLKTNNICPICRISDPLNADRNNASNSNISNEPVSQPSHNQVLNQMLWIQRTRYPTFYQRYNYSYNNGSFSFSYIPPVRSKSSNSFGGGSSRGGGGGGGSW